MAYKRKIGLLRFLGLKNKNLGFFKAVFQPCLLLADLQQSMPFSLNQCHSRFTSPTLPM